MATESPIRIVEGTDKWPPRKQSSSYGSSSSAKLAIEDLNLFLKSQRFQSLEKDAIPSRSESAPPSMEGSIAAIENIFSLRKSTLNPGLVYPNLSASNCEIDLQFHADPSSSSHGSDVNLGKKFNGSFSSWDNHRLFHHDGSSGNDWKMTPHANSADGSVRLHRNSLPSYEEESEDDRSSERSASASVDKAVLLSYPSGSLDSTQEDSCHSSSLSLDQYHSWIQKSGEEKVSLDATSHMLHNLSVTILSSGTNALNLENMRQVSQSDPLTTPPLSLSHDDSKGIVVRTPLDERGLSAVKVDVKDNLSTGEVGDVDSLHIEVGNGVNAPNALNSDHQKIHKKEPLLTQNHTLQQQSTLRENGISRVQGSYSQMMYPGTSHVYGSLNQFHFGSSSVSTADVQPILQTSGFTPPFYSPATSFMTPQSPGYPNLHPAGFFTPQYGMGGYTFNSAFLPSYLPGYPPQGAIPLTFDSASFPASGVSDGGNAHAYDMQNLQKFYGQVGVAMQPPSVDPYHMQYFQPPIRNPYGAFGQFDRQSLRDDAVVNQANARDLKKGADLIGLPNDQKPQHSTVAGYNSLNIGRGNVSNHYSLTHVGPMMQFPSASIISPVGPAKPAGGTNFHGGRHNMSHSHSFYGNTGKTYGMQNQSWNDMNSYSFLEELKSGKGQRFELSDIIGHIDEFSVDQHGSRFIQQKLETCSVEEKASVFKEVVPHASKLMTDVFGNYVIQKLFEYGSLGQKKDLANQLEGQILPLSLQMYGCRVIQKAFEVIDLEQKVRLARELDGHVLRCVRDQNGNHVIQKCIESIPADKINFIISSFRGQVATLSMHPYGCRVIQRVLEHCNDELLTQFIVNEILDSVCSLAQDQYGNYVTQHVLERGIHHERSEIIEKLSGSIVQLSQHKFASNVVEKCLEYGDSIARDMLIKEIIGHGDKNDNILIMMKDQYANYVIQKILQNCTSDQREMLLSLIRNHLTALKKYTYGKHIVARFEQLYGEDIQSSGS